MRRAVMTGVLSTAIVLAGCGGDDDAGTPAAGGVQAADGTLEVVAEDIDFGADTYEATAGALSVRYRNDGSIKHTLVIEEVDGFKLEVDGNGDEDQGTVDLAAGTYTLYCDVAGHRAAGMEATLEAT